MGNILVSTFCDYCFNRLEKSGEVDDVKVVMNGVMGVCVMVQMDLNDDGR